VILGIDARATAEVQAGRGRYVRELLLALARLEDDGTRYRLYAREPWGPPPELGAGAGAELPRDRFAWSLRGLPDPAWHAAVALAASRSCAAFLSTNSYLTAWMTRIPTAVVVHDLVAFVDAENAQARAARIERATIGRAVRRAGAFLCVSEATRRDLVARFPAAADRTRVVPLAVDPRFATPGEPARIDVPYVLGVGTLEPRKNLVRLIEAWASLSRAARGNHVLALVGPTGWDVDATLAAARAHPDDVRLLGFVSDAQLASLYAGATAFAYPSTYEGFGLPVLEAMAAGAPVVTSSVSSLPEVAGDAAVLVDPYDVRALRDALAAVLGDPGLRESLRERGRARAARFSWARTASETLAVLQGLANGAG
jgi:glycosyltransferase involved in cell wall biosynthesis